MEILFGKLDSAYPDKVIVGLSKDHKKWGETVTELYRELGYLLSEVSDQITPILSGKRLKYTARVEEVVPVSRRNKHAKSSIVAISIKAEVSDEEVPEKNSVPKIDR